MGKKSRRMSGNILQTIRDEDRRTFLAVLIALPVAIIIAVVVIADACTR